MSRALVVLLLVASAGVAAPVPKSLKKSLTLEGRWQAVTMTQGGADVSRANPTVWDVRGDTVTRSFREPDGTLRADTTTATISWPDAARRDEIDYTLNYPGAKSLFRARLKLTADELVIRFADQDSPRPADLTDGRDGWYYVYRRANDQ
jgi:uncharacterized protein (TIGR03067 family)